MVKFAFFRCIQFTNVCVSLPGIAVSGADGPPVPFCPAPGVVLVGGRRHGNGGSSSATESVEKS